MGGMILSKKKKIIVFCSLLFFSFLHFHLHLHFFRKEATRDLHGSCLYIVTSSILPTSNEVFTERSSKRGIISNNSLSWVSENQDDIGIAC